MLTDEIKQAAQEACDRADWLEIELEMIDHELDALLPAIAKFHNKLRVTQSEIFQRAFITSTNRRNLLLAGKRQTKEDIRHYRLIAKLLEEECV